MGRQARKSARRDAVASGKRFDAACRPISAALRVAPGGAGAASNALTLYQPAVIGAHFMASNRPFGQARCAARCPRIGQAPQRTRWPVSCHRRPGSFARMPRCVLLDVRALRRKARLAFGQNNPGEMSTYHRRLVLAQATLCGLVLADRTPPGAMTRLSMVRSPGSARHIDAPTSNAP